MNKQEILSFKPGKDLDLLVAKKVMNFDIESGEQLKSNYSTDAGEIWTIVDSIVKRGFIYTLSNSENKHVCTFDSINTHRRFIVHAETLIEAVCKAAILAMEDFNRMEI